jgi:hypothetical protein
MYTAFNLKLLDEVKSLLLVTMNYDDEKIVQYNSFNKIFSINVKCIDKSSLSILFIYLDINIKP